MRVRFSQSNSKPMKRSLLCIGLSGLIFVACKKTVTSPNLTTTDSTVITYQEYTGISYPVNPDFNCQYSPNYGDSIVYPQPPPGNDYFILPKNNTGLTGTYYSWPAGLSINPTTGSINLTRSQTGQRYSIGFVLKNGSDTCMTSLIIAGASYIDSIYNLSVSSNTAPPYFNANPFGPQPCAGPGCFFDWNGFAANQGIIVDLNTGVINLTATMLNNPFGPSPANGTTIQTTIYYALNDNSNYAHQEIDLLLMYFNHRSDIPESILNTVSNNISGTLSDALLSKGPSVRPPYLIIVRDN